ncbi:MAG: hypothetical protein V1725_03695 [archaeon]
MKRKTGIIIAVIIMSILLYLAGVMSGLFANKLLEQRTKQDLQSLRSYVDVLDANVKNMQLEQVFAETLSREEYCKFSAVSTNYLVGQLREYWLKLPFRIEEYEQTNKLSDTYLQLKKEYTQVSIRTWIVVRNKYSQCNAGLLPVLYLYNANCTSCTEQGKELDDIQRRALAEKKDILVLTVDSDADEIIIKTLKQYYGITSTPAIIIGNRVFQGRVFTADQLSLYV